MLITGLFTSVLASNPVTLTSFYNTFNYLDEVRFVLDNGTVDGRMIAFLVDQNNPIDEKAGIINALAKNNKFKSNALTFRQYVSRKYGENWQDLNLDKLSADELFCLGYLTIMDEDGSATNGLPILDLAEQKNPYSKTIRLFKALAFAEQSIGQGNACDGWKACNEVKSNTTLNNDLDAGVANQIFDVMESYNDGCE